MTSSEPKKKLVQMAPTRHPLPLLCVGSCYIPLDTDGHQATTSSGQKFICVERNDSSSASSSLGATQPTSGAARDRYLTIPLNFGLEMAASFPKSYRWLSEEARRSSSTDATSSNSTSVPTRQPLDEITVYSLQDDVSVVQISDDHRHQPVEYQTCFTSRRHLEEAWATGRSYLLAATLANRASIRQRVFNAVHRKFAQIAMHGVVFPFGMGPQDDANRNEDEDGLMEPPEVQQLAAELGMHNGPDSIIGMDPNRRPPPAIAQFGATMLCGMISLMAPIAQAVSGTMDALCGAIPVVDKLVLGESAPPRKAPIEEHSMFRLLEEADEQNTIAAAHVLGDGMDKRLATSALWMGISIQLLLSQYIASTMAKDTASIVLASRSPQNGHGGKAGTKLGTQSIAERPIVMDVFSGLVTSLQANDFVREAASGDEGGREDLVSAVELEEVLRQNNGVEIGFKRKDLGPVKELDASASAVRGKGIILIGGLIDHQANRAVQRMPAVGVMNAEKLLRVTKKNPTLAGGKGTTGDKENGENEENEENEENGEGKDDTGSGERS